MHSPVEINLCQKWFMGNVTAFICCISSPWPVKTVKQFLLRCQYGPVAVLFIFGVAFALLFVAACGYSQDRDPGRPQGRQGKQRRQVPVV